MIEPPNLCNACVHMHFHPGGLDERPKTCDAYPDGIPREFLVAGAAHISSDGSDRGVVFEARPGEYAQRVIETFAAFWDTFGDDIDMGSPGPGASISDSD